MSKVIMTYQSKISHSLKLYARNVVLLCFPGKNWTIERKLSSVQNHDATGTRVFSLSDTPNIRQNAAREENEAQNEKLDRHIILL